MNQPTTPSAPLLLVCINGKDRYRHILVGRQPVVMAHASYKPTMAVKEMLEGQGHIVFNPLPDGVHVEAANCRAPLYINGAAATQGLLRENDVLRIGDSTWLVQHPAAGLPGAQVNFREQFSSLIGLEALQDFRLSTIFSEVLKKHTREEMEDQLITGTARHTPPLSAIEVGWGRPWLFARLLLWSAILAFILYAGFNMFNYNINLVPGLIFVGSFAVPVSALIFFLEMNSPRNVSIFTVTQLLFVGGVASLMVALLLFSKFDFFSSFLGASAAGIIEESAKLLVVILLIGKNTRYRWILNGLLIGAAVGTGFGAFESAGYALRTMLDDGVDAGVNNIMLRGLLAPFGHIVWTANVAAALWLVKKDRPFSWDMLQAPALLRILIAMMILHMLWNAPFSLVRLPIILDLKYLLLGVVAWGICFRLVQAGLKQLNEARQAEVGLTGAEVVPITAGIKAEA